MLVKEFRISLPLTVEEYQIGQLYSVAEASKNETGGGEGIEVVKNEEFKNVPLLGGKYNAGQYTYKIYHLQSKVPAFLKLILPKGSMEINEEAWNAYPYCRTIITNPKFMKENFKIEIDSLHLPGLGTQHNVHQLPDDVLKTREVIQIDIANDPVNKADYKTSEDPKKFKSEKTGRGPLDKADWMENAQPVMTCYKLVTCEFKWFGLQTKVENFIQKAERRIFTNFHRQVFCWMDRFYGLSLKDIRAHEEKTKADLDKMRKEGQVRGMTGKDSE